MKKFLKFLKYLLITTIIVAIIGAITGVGIITYQGYSLYKEAINEMSISEKIEEIKEETDVYTEYEKLPKQYVNAVVAVEDRRFFEHNGVDLV